MPIKTGWAQTPGMTYDGPPIIPGQQQPYTLSSLMPASKPPRPGWVAPVIALLVVLVLGSAGVAAWALLRPAASGTALASTTTTPAAVVRTTVAPEPFTASGIITLIDDNEHWKVGDQCEGSGGFSDIQGGADVVVSGPDGESLALASLIGDFSKQDGARVVCNFTFMVLNVPAGKGIYTLTIGHRPKKFTEADLRAEISLSLGGS